MNLTQSQLDALLRIAGNRLGCDPQQLRQNLENGDLGRATQSLGPEQRQKMNQLLQNPQELSRLLETPQVRQLIAQLTKGR